MAFAVIQTGGKQYKVSPGDVIEIESLSEKKEGDKVSFDEVLLSGDDKNVNVGAPLVSGKKVSGVIIGEGKGKKISVVRFKSKSRWRREKGHRQYRMKVEIQSVA
jgi:large subunit ribosomal protein L21